MTVEMKVEEAQVVEVVEQPEGVKAVEEVVKVVQEDGGEKKIKEADKPEVIEKSSSFKEESNYLSDLKEHERKALSDLKAKLEEAILGNNLFKEEKKEDEKAADEKEKTVEEEKKEDGEAKEGGDCEVATGEEAEKEELRSEEASGEEKLAQECEEEKKPDVEVKIDEKKAEEEKKTEVVVEEKCGEIDRDISIWGVPLLPSKGDESTDVVLLKFLRAREFKVNDAFEMLKKTLQWRKELKIDSILDENLGTDLGSVAYMNGVDREGHPVCYNIYGVFDDQELYQKTFGTEEKREQFLRWRFQLMEKGIEKLDLKPGGVCSILQITDLKNSPGPSKKELRVATKQAVALLQDNYPEFVAKNIFVNVPFWIYAFHAVLAPFLTLRTKSKFLFVRPAKVTETLLKYIPAEEIPIQYGGFKRENDFEFSCEETGVSEVTVKAGSTETVEIPTPEVGETMLWDLTVLGWEVNYKEEFVPADEGSYTIIIQKGKKFGPHKEPIRNSFKNSEPGKIVLTIENGSSKKKRILFRYKTKKSSP